MAETGAGLRVERRDGALWLTIDREEHANLIDAATAIAMTEQIRAARGDRGISAVVITGAGDRFFCIGGQKDEYQTYDYSAVFPIVDLYEAIDSSFKPVVAAVNGFAVGGGNVLQTVCDLSIASDRAVFRQVGPSMGSFDAGYGTWYLEATIGRKRAKELWYLNRKYSAEEALAMGLVNEVVPHERLVARVEEVLAELRARGPQAIAALKTAFAGKHSGVVGQSRMGHDLLLTRYLRSEEAGEMSSSFKDRRPPDAERYDR